MTEIRFYHLQTSTLDQALPPLLMKALESGKRAVVRLSDTARIEQISQRLWTSSRSFLPHGSAKEGFAADQPVWLTTTEENPNGADVLILTGGATAEQPENFALCCEMLDGHDENAVSAARARWKTYQEKGYTLTYWQQTPKGGWEQKNAA